MVLSSRPFVTHLAVWGLDQHSPTCRSNFLVCPLSSIKRMKEFFWHLALLFISSSVYESIESSCNVFINATHTSFNWSLSPQLVHRLELDKTQKISINGRKNYLLVNFRCEASNKTRASFYTNFFQKLDKFRKIWSSHYSNKPDARWKSILGNQPGQFQCIYLKSKIFVIDVDFLEKWVEMWSKRVGLEI